jgi:transcription elongation factor Elf1
MNYETVLVCPNCQEETVVSVYKDDVTGEIEDIEAIQCDNCGDIYDVETVIDEDGEPFFEISYHI